MFLFRSTSRLYIKSKLEKIKNLVGSTKDRRGVKRYR